MYAIVQFLTDSVKAIVPVSDIKNFQTDTFKENSHPVHETFWKSKNASGYYYAVVHLVAETREELKVRMKKVKFLLVRKLSELLRLKEEEDESIKEKKSIKEIRGKTKANQEKRTACENKKYLNAINEKIEGTKKRSLSNEGRGESPSKCRKVCPSISPNESSDGDELILKSELDRINADLKTALRKLKAKNTAYEELKKKYLKLQELNVDLQTQLLTLLKGNSSVDPPPTQRLSHPVESNKRGSVDPPPTQRLSHPVESNKRGSVDPPPTQRLSHPVESDKRGSGDQKHAEKAKTIDDDDYGDPVLSCQHQRVFRNCGTPGRIPFSVKARTNRKRIQAVHRRVADLAARTICELLPLASEVQSVL